MIQGKTGMSEALSTSEIEDVLSSIRRLVSDDLRPAPKSSAVAEEASKLLLTPALRVVQDTSAANARPIDDVVASVGAGVDQQAEDWEPETGDHSLDLPLTDSPAEMWEDVPVIEDYAAPVDFISARRVEADPAEEADSAFVAQAVAPVDAVAEPVQDEALPGWAQSAGAEEADASRPAPLSGGTVEPDATWADEAEAAVLQELQSAARIDRPHGPDEFELHAREAVDAEGDEVPVDEAMLREIVRDVLREELQGRLGERITRNIRKLVRAEIARVMASDDLL